MPKELTIMGFIVGNLSSSLKLVWMGGSGFEKTESNCCRIRFAFLTGSLVERLFWSLISGHIRAPQNVDSKTGFMNTEQMPTPVATEKRQKWQDIPGTRRTLV